MIDPVSTSITGDPVAGRWVGAQQGDFAAVLSSAMTLEQFLATAVHGSERGPSAGSGSALSSMTAIPSVGAAAAASPLSSAGAPAAGSVQESRAWAEALPEDGMRWVSSIEAAAEEAGIDPRLLAAVVWAESDFRADAVSSAGAIGLAQLMPATAELLGVDPWDPVENLRGGAEFLAFTIERFGRIDLGLAAYNAGPARVAEYGGAPPVTHAYIDIVLDHYQHLGGAT